MHRLKFFGRGPCPPQHELLASFCQALGLAPGTSLRFFDDDDGQVLLNSCVPSSTELTAVAGAGADAGAPFHASPVATVGDDSGAGNVGRSDSDEDANPANETVMIDEVAADRTQTSGGGSLRPEMVPGWLPDRPRLCSAMAPGFGFRPGPVRERAARPMPAPQEPRKKRKVANLGQEQEADDRLRAYYENLRA